jgi:hypothetical protein
MKWGRADLKRNENDRLSFGPAVLARERTVESR